MPWPTTPVDETTTDEGNDNPSRSVFHDLIQKVNQMITSPNVYAAYKAGNTDRTNTTSSVVDPDLSVPLDPGTYEFEAFVIYQCLTTTSQGINMYLPAFDANAKTIFHDYNSNQTRSMEAYYLGNNLVYTAPRNSNRITALFKGSFVVNSSSNFELFWSQFSSNANATRVCAGSYLRATKIA